MSMDREFISSQRRVICARMRRYEGFVRRAREEGRPLTERERFKLRVIVPRLERVLELMKENRYGVCTQCGEKINIRRLRAIPGALCCLECQQMEDTRDAA